ncbi:MAG: phosphate ABC transporter ATP-binding protein [Anaerolineales bacterium]|jgi:tungstate transport system ATP-binding protein
MDEVIFRLRNLKKEYENRCVLHVDSLDIFSGEIFAIVGPSGAGKSTILRLMNFLEPPSEGKIIYHMHDFSAQHDIPIALRRRVTTVFQTSLLLNRSVWANIQFGLKIRSSQDSSQKIEDVLQRVGLSEFSQRRARTLSGGEAQRVALARAMVIQPEILLLDEPTTNLDPYNVSLIEDTVKELNNKNKTTIIIVTHNIFQAQRLAKRVALMLNGELVEVAEVQEFFQNPKDSRTEAFIRGEMVY